MTDLTDFPTLRQAAAESHVNSVITGQRGMTAGQKSKLRLAVAEYLSAMPDADVPVVTASTARAFVRRLPRRLHCRA